MEEINTTASLPPHDQTQNTTTPPSISLDHSALTAALAHLIQEVNHQHRALDALLQRIEKLEQQPPKDKGEIDWDEYLKSAVRALECLKLEGELETAIAKNGSTCSSEVNPQRRALDDLLQRVEKLGQKLEQQREKDEFDWNQYMRLWGA
jgi:BMFP domain-containing protein YqiC